MNVYEMLKEIEGQLQGVEGINTVKIGLESSMTARDYPAIRLVSTTNNRTSYLEEDMAFDVYFGDNMHEKIGIDEIYRKLYEWENIIRERLDLFQTSSSGLVKWKSTVSDEDRLQGYKILVSRFVVDGVR